MRAYSYAEWRAYCAEAGLTVTHTEDDAREPYEFASWTERLRMPADQRDALEHWLLAAPPRFRERFEVAEHDGRVVSLRGTFGLIVARKGR